MKITLALLPALSGAFCSTTPAPARCWPTLELVCVYQELVYGRQLRCTWRWPFGALRFWLHRSASQLKKGAAIGIDIFDSAEATRRVPESSRWSERSADHR